MYYTHDYSDKHFETYDEAEADLLANCPAAIYAEELYDSNIDLTLVLSEFFNNDNQAFCGWLQDEIDEAFEYICNEYITVHDDDKDE